MLAVNLTGAIALTKAALPKLSRPGGVIVNIASALGLGGCPGFSIYTRQQGGTDRLYAVARLGGGPRGDSRRRRCAGTRPYADGPQARGTSDAGNLGPDRSLPPARYGPARRRCRRGRVPGLKRCPLDHRGYFAAGLGPPLSASDRSNDGGGRDEGLGARAEGSGAIQSLFPMICAGQQACG